MHVCVYIQLCGWEHCMWVQRRCACVNGCTCACVNGCTYHAVCMVVCMCFKCVCLCTKIVCVGVSV